VARPDHPEKVFDEKNAYVFGKFLGERYKNNAVMWFPGGDSAPGKYEAVWVAMAKGLKDGSGGSQLVCYHGQGSLRHHVVSQGGLARLQLHPIRASFRLGQFRVRQQGLCVDAREADRGHGAGIRESCQRR
jgi:hypothetical protein